MMRKETDKNVKEHFESFLITYQEVLENRMKDRNFKLRLVINLMRNKIAVINPVNKYDDKRFQYAETVTLNHKEIAKNSERISNNKKC